MDFLLGSFFDHLEVSITILFALFVLGLWLWLGRRDEWIVVAHRVTRGVIALSVTVVAVHCAEALDGGGERIGSKSVGVRSGQSGIAIQVVSPRIDPDEVPSSRMLNKQGIVAVDGLRSGVFAWAALTRASFEIPVVDSPHGAKPAVVVSAMLSMLPWFGGLLVIERILWRARRGDPFAEANLRALRRLAVLVTGGTYVSIAVDYFVARWASSGAFTTLMLGPASIEVGPRLTIPFLPLVAGALILALAEVWRRGVALREEAEATV